MPRRSLLLALLFVACGDPELPDAGRADAGAPDAGPPPVEPSEPAPAAAPVLTPCPAGWREVAGPDFVECDPWPEGGHASCGSDEAHFPGEPGCVRIGEACPADGVPVGLPADAIHVRAGATGGDGSEGAPYGTLAEALDAAPPGAVIGLAVGTYPESVILRDRDVTLVGACADSIIEPGGTLTAFIVDGVTLGLRDLRIRSGGGGVLARQSQLTLESVVLDDLRDTPIALSTSSHLDARELVVRRTSGTALLATTGSNTSLSRVAIEDIRGVALTLRDGVHEGTAIVVDGVSGGYPGLFSLTTTTARYSQLVALFDPFAASFVIGGTLRLTDSVLVAPEGAGEAAEGTGILGTAGSTIEMERVTMTRATGLALGVGEPGGHAAFRDLVIRDVLEIGHALEIGEGATGELERVWIERAGNNGALFFGDGTTVSATDLNIRDSQPDALGLWGRGMGIQTGASLSAERVWLSGHHEVSLVAASSGTRVTLTDLLIENTLERGCAASGCAPAGIGLGTYLGGWLRAERFRIEGNALVGAQLASGGQLELADGVVTDNPVGVNVQVPGYELARLTDRVEYRDNGVNLESSELYVPTPTVP